MFGGPLHPVRTALAVALACTCTADTPTSRTWPTTSWELPVSMFRRVEVHDAESLPDGTLMLGGSVGDRGLVARIDAGGVAALQPIGRFITDLAPAPDGELFAVGWDDDGAAFWRVGRDGEILEHTPLPVSAVGVDPYRVLPGPIVIGTHNPITSGELHGWILRLDGDQWREQIERGGGYSGFLAAAATDDGFVAAGMGSDTATYQGWVGVERSGTWQTRHVGNGYQILHTVAPLPSGGFVVAGIGRAATLDDSLAVVAEVSWPDPGVFGYAPTIVDGDVAWLLTRHGRLRNTYTRVEVLRLGLTAPMIAPERFRVHDGATGGALVRRPDGTIWSVVSSGLGRIKLEPITP